MNNKLDYSNAEPLSVQLAWILEEKLLKTLKAGESLPTLRCLANEYNVGVAVAREALNIMKKKGLVLSRMGMGTFKSARSQNVSTIKVLIAAGPTIIPILEKMIAAYEESNPGEKVTIETVKNISDENVNGKGESPDLIFISESNFSDVQTRYLSELKEDNFSNVLNKIKTRAKNLFIRKGRRYGIALCHSPVMTLANCDLFKKAGVKLPAQDWTLEDFEKLKKKMTFPQKGIMGFTLTRQPNRWLNFLLGAGASLETRKGRKYFVYDDPKLIQSVKQVKTILDDSSLIYNERAEMKAFLEGRIAMILASYYTLSEIISEKPSFEVAFRPLFRQEKTASLLLASGLCIPKNANNYCGAIKLMKHILSKDSQKFAGLNGMAIPINEKALSSSSFKNGIKKVAKDYDSYKTYGNEVQLLEAFSKDEEWQKFLYQMELVWSGIESPENALLKMIEQQN